MNADLISLRAFRYSLCAVFAVFLFIPTSAMAAYIYLEPSDSSLHRGDTITIAARIDTDEGECINTADVVLEYSDSIRAVDISRGESILSVWVEDPVIDKENNRITFAGGIPGGYCGRIDGDPQLTNILAEFVFRSPGFNIGGGDKLFADITFNDATQVLLNDGRGTRAALRTSGARIELLDDAGQGRTDDWSARVEDDDIPPADFPITLSREDSAFSGKYFITFNTQDKQSGIDHYEVMEEPFEDFDLFRWGRADAPWHEATSPYVLKDQSLNSTIRVRAIDKAGNVTISTHVPEAALRSVSRERFIATALILSVGLLIAFGIGYGLLRRRKQLAQEFDHEDEDNEDGNTHDHTA